jgi:hypothetical protein
MLPDVGGSIHVQGGGGYGPSVGGAYSSDDTRILSEYGLQNGGIIADKVDELTKTAFLEQIRSGKCSTDSGDSIILKKDCWAVVAVIRALIKRDLGGEHDNGANNDDLPAPAAPAPAAPAPVAPAPPAPAAPAPPAPALTLSQSTTLPKSDTQRPPPETLQTPISKVDNKLQINTNKEEFYANLNVKGKSIRVRGKTPTNLTQKYKNLAGGKKPKTHKVRKSKAKLRTRRKYRA